MWSSLLSSHLYFSCPFIENFIWIEPLLRGHLSYKATFSLSQRWPLNTGLTLHLKRDIKHCNYNNLSLLSKSYVILFVFNNIHNHIFMLNLAHFIVKPSKYTQYITIVLNFQSIVNVSMLHFVFLFIVVCTIMYVYRFDQMMLFSFFTYWMLFDFKSCIVYCIKLIYHVRSVLLFN